MGYQKNKHQSSKNCNSSSSSSCRDSSGHGLPSASILHQRCQLSRSPKTGHTHSGVSLQLLHIGQPRTPFVLIFVWCKGSIFYGRSQQIETTSSHSLSITGGLPRRDLKCVYHNYKESNAWSHTINSSFMSERTLRTWTCLGHLHQRIGTWSIDEN